MGSMHAFPVPTHCGKCEKSKKTHKAKVKQSTDIATSLSVQHTLEEGYSQEKEFRGFRKIKTDQTNSLKNCNTNRSLAVIEFSIVFMPNLV